jgi:hypothetical protein
VASYGQKVWPVERHYGAGKETKSSRQIIEDRCLQWDRDGRECRLRQVTVGKTEGLEVSNMIPVSV